MYKCIKAVYGAGCGRLVGWLDTLPGGGRRAGIVLAGRPAERRNPRHGLGASSSTTETETTPFIR